MSLAVFLAVIGAAVLHAVWNALVKGGSDRLMGMAAIVFGHVIAGILTLPFTPFPLGEAWPYLIFGAFLHFGYHMFLLQSYNLGDLTQVYPIARGSAPLIVAVVSVGVLGVALSLGEMLAVAMIGVGIISLALVRQADGLRNKRAAVFALITGCFIASYSLVDGIGARYSGTPTGFFAWLSIINGMMMASFLVWRSPGTFRKIAVQGKVVMFLGGGASFIAYALVVWAFTQAPIALVTALRETSIIFALLIGVFFLKEKLNLAKVASTFCTLSGAALLKITN